MSIIGSSSSKSGINEPSFPLTLRDIEEQELPLVLDFYNDIETFKFATGLESPIDIGSVELHYHSVQEDPLKGLLGIWSTEPASGKEVMVGILSFWARYPEEEWATIGLLLIAKSWQRKGIGTEVVRMLEKHLQEKFGIRVFRVGTIDHKAAPLPFWLSLGFKASEVQRHYTVIEGSPRDVIWLIRSI